MRRYAWLALAAFSACSTSSEDVDLVTQPTRVRVSPAAFLGDTPCSDEGGMRLYQATLFDVTDGLENAFALPSSDLVACTADVEFQYVQAGRYYIAEVRGFDRSDIELASLGSPLVVAESGGPIAPRWTTTCWGEDGVTPEDLGLGGATSESQGGAGGGGPDLGVRSFSKTIVTVRGCEPLSDSGSDGTTRVSISIQRALVDLTCGDEAGQVATFRLTGQEAGTPLPSGGAGGLGGSASDEDSSTEMSAACGEQLLVAATADGSQVSFEVEGLDGEAGEVIWTTTCTAVPQEGITVSATCDPARPL